MQITANTPDFLQGYAIHYGTYIENRLYSAALSHRKGYSTSPYQELYGVPASFEHCYPFGCAAYYFWVKDRILVGNDRLVVFALRWPRKLARQEGLPAI